MRRRYQKNRNGAQLVRPGPAQMGGRPSRWLPAQCAWCAQVTAKHNFTHALQYQHRDTHALVTHGIYRRALRCVASPGAQRKQVAQPGTPLIPFVCLQLREASRLPGMAVVGRRDTAAPRQPSLPGSLSTCGERPSPLDLQLLSCYVKNAVTWSPLCFRYSGLLTA